MKLIPWVLKSRKAKVDEAHALSTRDTCSDIVSLDSSTTPSNLRVDTLSTPSMNGRRGPILGLDLGLETISSFVFDGCTFMKCLQTHVWKEHLCALQGFLCALVSWLVCA